MPSPPKSLVSGPEVRAAAKWLKRRDVSLREISPRQFAIAAKAMNLGFKDTMQFLIGQNFDVNDED